VAEISIKGARRTEFGKGASRRSRRDGFIPAVIYGHGEKPQHVALPSRELGIALKTSNVLIDVVLDDHTELTLPKSVSRDPLTGLLEHIDLVIVRRGERVVVSVPVHTEGKYDQDGILEHTNNSIEVETDVTNIPAFLVLNMEGMMAGESKSASDVVLPEGVKLRLKRLLQLLLPLPKVMRLLLHLPLPKVMPPLAHQMIRRTRRSKLGLALTYG